MATNSVGEKSKLDSFYAGAEMMRFGVAQMPPK
jgi:hypothetical protein